MEVGEPLLNDHKNHHHIDEDRRNFIRKVLGIVCSQVIVSVALVYELISTEATRLLIQNPLILIPAFIGYLIIACALVCCKHVARKVPTNYILLFALTICISIILAVICQMYTEASLMNALILTVFTTVGLTFFALVYRPKMTVVIGAIVVVFLAILVTLIMFFVTGGSSAMLYLYYFLGVVFYGLFLVFDLIRLTNRKYGLSEDDYVFAALMIYLDIVNLFLEILKLVGNKK